MSQTWRPHVLREVLWSRASRLDAPPSCCRGGEESRPCNHINISRKPRPVGGELHSQHFFGWRCIICGEIVGQVIFENRREKRQ